MGCFHIEVVPEGSPFAEYQDPVIHRNILAKAPDVPEHHSENSFLYDWWSQFWDIYATARNKGSNQTSQEYLEGCLDGYGDEVRLAECCAGSLRIGVGFRAILEKGLT